MPSIWKASIVILVACLAAAMVIGIVRLVQTPTEILGAGFRGLPTEQHHPSSSQGNSSASRR